jgi:hypothetical protein
MGYYDKVIGSYGDKCFACDRNLDGSPIEFVQVVGESTTVMVGLNCYRTIKRYDREHGGLSFYQPPKGGPQLALIGSRG